jgi:hypothetical protein
MTIDEDTLKKWKATFAKDGIAYDTDEEYYDAINNLVGFFEILIEIDQNQKSSVKDKDEGMYLVRQGRK